MKFFTALVLAAAGSALAKGNSKAAANKTLSTKAQCKEVAKLTQLTELASNETELTKVTKGNSTKAAAIQAKASDAATQLTTLQANATLMTTCNQIFAVEDMEDDCDSMLAMQSLSALVANQTKLDAKTKNNATKADALKAKVAAQADSLTALESNTTLTAFCSGLTTQDTCSTMSKLQKEVAAAANTTALDAKFNGNATKIAAAQAKAAKAQTKLDAMTSNTTLTDACTALKATTGASTSDSATNNASSGAGSVKPMGAMVSLAALFFAGVMLL